MRVTRIGESGGACAKDFERSDRGCGGGCSAQPAPRDCGERLKKGGRDRLSLPVTHKIVPEGRCSQG